MAHSGDAPAAVELPHAIEEIVRRRLQDGYCDLKGAAAHAGMSPQAMQRRLRRAGLTYRQILDRVRIGTALELIRGTDRSLTDIALSLGYHHPGNFSRAFRRTFGRSPTRFRGSGATDGC